MSRVQQSKGFHTKNEIKFCPKVCFACGSRECRNFNNVQQCWRYLTILTIFNNLDNFWQFSRILTIFDNFYNSDHFYNFLQFWQVYCFFTIFDNWRQFWKFRQLLLPFWQLKRQSWRLVTFETLITSLTIENLNSWQFLLSDN